MTKDEFYMGKALAEAKTAYAVGEFPIGAVIVYEKKVVARAYNLRESLPCATAHAELLAIEKACRALNRWRLTGCTLYVTVEPCPMCAGAIVNSRLTASSTAATTRKPVPCAPSSSSSTTTASTTGPRSQPVSGPKNVRP